MRTTIDRGRAARTTAPPVERPQELPLPPVRLRFVLLIGLVGAAAAWLYPRLDAAWKVHTLAAALADYGACMVGPTGPALLRDRQLSDFHVLTRRRLVTAPAGEAPFERCAGFARVLTGDASVEAAHRTPAVAFAEYGASAKATTTLRALLVTPEPLVAEARRAWPILRSYGALVKPSLGVKEAAHPVAAAAPTLGRGLTPAHAYYRVARATPDGIVLARGAGANLEVWRSTDGGATFKAAPTTLAEGFAERCPTGGDGRSFVLRGNGDVTNVVSVGPAGDVSAATVAKAGETVAAVACDERALVAAVRPDHGGRATLFQCGFGVACAPVPPPSFGRPELGLDYPLDVGRVGGTTILALRMGNLVRVTSSRDGGASWTPLSVAYDGGEHPLPAARVPSELLTIGRRVLLHGSALRPTETYGLLYSDDQGASFRGL
jgi:hypothetical protein